MITANIAGKSSDLLMDVIRAADPVRERKALYQLQGQQEVNSFKTVMARSSPLVPVTATSGLVRSPDHSPSPSPSPSPRSAGAAFEAAMLSALVEDMFSNKSNSAFGAGVAGSSFKSLFAEHIANQIVRSGGLGLAEIIDKFKGSRSIIG